jgi:hypothetical protein
MKGMDSASARAPHAGGKSADRKAKVPKLSFLQPPAITPLLIMVTTRSRRAAERGISEAPISILTPDVLQHIFSFLSEENDRCAEVQAL